MDLNNYSKKWIIKNKHLYTLFISLFLLNILDILTTYIGINQFGFVEYNVFMAGIIEMSWFMFTLFKVLCVLLMTFMIGCMRWETSKKAVTYGMCFLFLTCLVNNMICIAKVC